MLVHQEEWFNATKINDMNNYRVIDNKAYKFVFAEPTSEYIEAVEVCYAE